MKKKLIDYILYCSDVGSSDESADDYRGMGLDNQTALLYSEKENNIMLVKWNTDEVIYLTDTLIEIFFLYLTRHESED